MGSICKGLITEYLNVTCVVIIVEGVQGYFYLCNYYFVSCDIISNKRLNITVLGRRCRRELNKEMLTGSVGQ